MQWIAGQGDNGAYGMRLKNVSGSSSASAHRAWMMHSPLKGAKSLNRGVNVLFFCAFVEIPTQDPLRNSDSRYFTDIS